MSFIRCATLIPPSTANVVPVTRRWGASCTVGERVEVTPPTPDARLAALGPATTRVAGRATIHHDQLTATLGAVADDRRAIALDSGGARCRCHIALLFFRLPGIAMGEAMSVATHQFFHRYLVAILVEEAAAIKDLLDRPGDGGNFGIMEHWLVPAVHAAAYQALVPCDFAQVGHCLGDIATPRGQRQAAHGGGDPLMLAGELAGRSEERRVGKEC